MSEHMNKNRRHKEASLTNVTSIVPGQPVKKKRRSISQQGESDNDDFSTCLTINFKRGGGVDFQFKSTQERDHWYENLTKIVQQAKTNIIDNNESETIRV